ncbi:ATP-binding cassette domain-containing protein [Conexibacter stalactiti]|uniref:ATP-binding cassette domain-containing protein n=1 Tax=Conexibacter stalactiti TaxID=1940611 RepID=A0ABU4HW86_9ACTN|nr:ATP-binding cassette domain-containing protein [Conexibacter stalactiti]MDW5597495.1 ATP-binding cassette domain-containing protein [Conexibacter stalactiti]MEC5038137.1 ATP-binding cassette domain-containing protein [Conexibacter stalactiti]
MSLLVFDGVTKRYADARRARTALDAISLAVEPGELVAVWGGRASGRTTLLRVGAGLEQPDAGTVRFGGVDLAAGAEAATAAGLAYAQPRLLGPQRQPLLDRLAVALVARGARKRDARDEALAALERAGVGDCAHVRVGELDATESVRVGIAQALLVQPRLIAIDEPTATVPLIERDGILALLRAIADSGVAVLMTAGEAIGLAGVDRALTISAGRLRTNVAAERATVVPLRPASSV